MTGDFGITKNYMVIDAKVYDATIFYHVKSEN